jgi:hypothetical protein
MTNDQALTLALLLIEFELEAPQIQPAPPAWVRELTEARTALVRLKAQLAPTPSAEPAGPATPLKPAKGRKCRRGSRWQ